MIGMMISYHKHALIIGWQKYSTLLSKFKDQMELKRRYSWQLDFHHTVCRHRRAISSELVWLYPPHQEQTYLQFASCREWLPIRQSVLHSNKSTQVSMQHTWVDLFVSCFGLLIKLLQTLCSGRGTFSQLTRVLIFVCIPKLKLARPLHASSIRSEAAVFANRRA